MDTYSRATLTNQYSSCNVHVSPEQLMFQHASIYNPNPNNSSENGPVTRQQRHSAGAFVQTGNLRDNVRLRAIWKITFWTRLFYVVILRVGELLYHYIHLNYVSTMYVFKKLVLVSSTRVTYEKFDDYHRTATEIWLSSLKFIWGRLLFFFFY